MKKQKDFSWLRQGLVVKNTKRYGKGVFAQENIKKDEILAIFGGYVMTLSEEKKLPNSIRDLAHQINDDFVLGIREEKERQLVDNFNHSCDPNAGFNGQIFLVAMRNIKKDEEITFDYAMVLSDVKGKSPYKLKCFCGSKNCRGTVDDNGWKNPILQKKYNGYFQYYLQKKIEKKEGKSRVRIKKM